MTTNIKAFGNACFPLTARWSGAGAPPKRRASRANPADELSMRSETIDGTLV